MTDPTTIDEAAVRALIARVNAYYDPTDAETLAAICEALLDDPVRQVVQHPRFRSLAMWQDESGDWRSQCGLSGPDYTTIYYEAQKDDTPEAACAAALAALKEGT